MKEINNEKIQGLKCPKCGENAPVSGGTYHKRYSAEENGMRWFCFPIYMCDDDDCQIEFEISGCRLGTGKNVWQDPNVKREDWEGAEDWGES